jgi:hypothetical protein
MATEALSDRARRDKAAYHPDDPHDYASVVGVPYEDEETGEVLFACAGCYFCCGEDET